MSQTTRFILMFSLCGVAATPQQDHAAGMLSTAQRESFRQILQSTEKETKAQAESAARKIGEMAVRIDRNLLADKPDEELHRTLAAEFADAVAGLVRTAITAKVNTARDLVKVLTPDQKRRVLAELEKPDANPDLTELLGKVFAEPKK